MGVIGIACMMAYPLSPADVIPGSDSLPYGGIRSAHPFVVYTSAIAGPILLTWGAFAMRQQTRRPLTPRRSLLALLLSVLVSVAGIARYTYEWVQETPFVAGDTQPTTVDPSVSEIVLREVTGTQFIALTAVSAMIVGSVATRRGRRDAFVSALLPIGFALLLLSPISRIETGVTTFVGTAAMAIVPFSIGYLATPTTD
ncbi:hypothetical protein B2G88_14470 [Natronolimnobius baerhuensis]|uniref:DUF998 domain-containing protein n=2 Tax=Natronolimnobius baerhuensis TaxID=253108 RepID=A0A202E5S3_9EURY|nr:hypothetical protein B2G88_14470 [Natronolimnobius baerhuensis]